MATWDDVRSIASALPGTTENGERSWRVRDKTFVLERPLRVADRAHLGDRAPAEAPLGLHVADLGVKEALLGAEPDVFFTTPHFDGYPMVLARLEALDVAELQELVVDAWLSRAPRTLARQWLEEHPAQ
jgi:hypothetical protein